MIVIYWAQRIVCFVFGHPWTDTRLAGKRWCKRCGVIE